VHAGEVICWGYISVKCLDASAASQMLADHGRSCHRLADQWRVDCKKAKELGQKPPLPPQQQKKLEARKAKKEGGAASVPDSKGGKQEAPPVESDSSDDERNAADAAETEAGDKASGEAPSDKDRGATNAADQMAAIRGNKDLPRPPYPTLPNMNAPAPMSAKVAAVQAYIEKLSYNFTGVNYFDVRKHRPMGRILETGREITRQALPIKCVEAVFVGAYLTQGLKELERVPLSFRSQIDGVTYKHIVLALKHNS